MTQDVVQHLAQYKDAVMPDASSAEVQLNFGAFREIAEGVHGKPEAHLPPAMFKQIRDRFVARYRAKRIAQVSRTDT